ncbi:MAG TPA: M20/M25/M40 family metallo-hydrolase [Polyangiales bacterium]|nr:M20/M25/M40 family metallo-hydrolase [Polyangiales bacterium]
MKQLIERLVNVNSHTANVGGVNRVGELILEALRDLPLTVEVEAAPSGAHHLSFATARAAREPAILLVGHHDTVFPPGSFEGYTEDGDIARGPGVLDMKGGLAIIIDVLHRLELSELPVRFVTVADEEVGSPSGKKLLESLVPRCRAALVFEAGRAGDAIITARRGSGNAVARAVGKAAHAGNALAEGRNAIWALAKFVEAVSSRQGLISGASANVGLISGGTARNTVPDHARAELDLRFSDPAGQEAMFALLHEAASLALEGTRIDLDVQVSRLPWARTLDSAALAERYGACALAAGLQYSEAKTIGGGSDANTVGPLGLPAIDGLGPRGKGFHTPDEYIELSSLALKADALLRFLRAELRG